MIRQKKTSGSKDLSPATSFTARLAAYSATAVAAVLAAPSAEAASGNVADGMNFTGHSSVTFNFSNKGSTIDFGPLHAEFLATGSKSARASYSLQFQRIRLVGLDSGKVGNTAAGSLIKLAPESTLSQQLFFHSGGRAAYRAAIYNGPSLSHVLVNTTKGPLKSGGTGYFAFRASHPGDTAHPYYGWMQLKVTVDSDNYPTSIAFVPTADGIWGAYMSTDDPQFSNFKVGSPSTVPEPSVTALAGLGLLAFGAAGVRELRRRKAATLES